MAMFEIIKYEGDNSTFIWKHPCEDFNTKSKLIVHESQEAIFFLNGQALDTFGPGSHTLETKNIPLLRHILSLPYGGETPFHCEVYFINKAVQMAIKWGTDSKVRFLDPNLGIPLEIGASGEMNLAVSDSRKLLFKLVGTMKGIAWNDESAGFTKSLHSSFRPLISTAVKTHLSSTIKENNIDLLEIDENLEKLSEVLRRNISAGFEEYGLTVPQFYITNILLPEDDPNFRKIRELHTISLQAKMVQAEAFIKTTQADADAEITAARRKAEMERQLIETEIAKSQAERDLIRAQADAQAHKMHGMAEAEIMAAKGYSQKDVIQAEVQKAYAESVGNINIGGGGASGVVGDMLSIGLGMAAASAIAPQFNNMFSGMNPATSTPTPSAPVAKCAKCGADLPENAKFCLECGEKVVAAGMVVCPECKNTVPKGKFCPECGHKFVSACPKCGTELAPGAKFCPECGEKI